VTGPSLPELEAERDRLYAQLSMVGDFRRGFGQRELSQVPQAEAGCVVTGIVDQPETGPGIPGPADGC
jgi:hypothetical protein